jgi:3-phosphoshikimate 1-carboxyvinyltransferase
LIATDVATIVPAARLRGELRLPGDKSISHRALLLAALAAGPSRITGAGDGADVRSTAAAMRALGASVERRPDAGGRNVAYDVMSPGADGLGEPAGIIDCGNSGTSLRLITGMVAGLPMRVVLDGDESLRGRPVARIIEPLRRMGAVLHGRRQDSLPPLTVVGRTPLQGVDYTTPVPSAQVKSAILLAGLRAEGRTTVRERVATRDHTERMLRARGIDVAKVTSGEGVAWTVEGGTAVQAIDQHVPADISAAAFWLVAGAIHPDAELTLRDIGVNPTRRAVIDLLRAMGADIVERTTSPASDPEHGEPIADLVVRSSELHAIDLSPTDVAAAIDEIPVLCLAATRASGTTTIRGVGELRHKESDRVAGVAAGLAALGARVDVIGDDLIIQGGIARGGDRQPGRPSPGDDVRGRRSCRDRPNDHRAARLRGHLLSRLLRRHRRGTRMTKRVVLIGHPVAHSLSGAMQQAAFDELGIDAKYELWDRAPIDLADAVTELRTEEFLGANVTIPHKERVVPMVDRLTEDASSTGAVNTLTREGKRLVGHNTDVAGFKVALDKLVGRQKMPRTAVVLGAGGGARAVVYGLIREGFQRIVVFNRHLHRAEGMVKHFSRSAAHMDLRAMPWHESIIESELAKAKVLINSTSIGLGNDDTPLPAEILSAELMVLDLIYGGSSLLRDAEKAGCVVSDGGEMLLHQGAASFTLWTGQPAPLDVMQAALDEARARGVVSAEGEPAAPEPAA